MKNKKRNQVNTIPGFTVHIRYSKMFKEAGTPFTETEIPLFQMEEKV